MTKPTRPRLGSLLFALAALCAAAMSSGPTHAAGEQTGRIRGVVRLLESNEPLPGVTVVATSPSLIGPPRTTTSDERGRYGIENLPPGTYRIEYAFAGTAALGRTASVRQGETVQLDVPYSLEATAGERIDLTERRSLMRPDSTHTGSTRDANTLNRLPTGRTYQGVAQLVPGVTGGANPNIKGGLSSHNRFLIDGMDVTDPVSNTFAMNLTFDSIESTEILTGGASAEYNALGGVINVVPRGGGDTFHATTSAFLNNQRLSGRGNFGNNLWEGNQPFNDSEVGPTQSYEISANVGGPIIQNKLWYGATYEFDFTEASLVKAAPLGVAPYGIQHPSRRYIGHMLRLRLDYAATARHRLRFSASTDPASIDNNTQSNSSLGVTEVHQNQGGLFAQLRWDWLASEQATFSVVGGYIVTGLEIGPQGRLGKVGFAGCDKFSAANCSYDPNRQRRTNSIDGTGWYQGGNYRTDDRYRIQVDPSLSLRGSFAGRHVAKIGLQNQFLWRKRKQQTPGGSVFTDTSPTGVGLEAGLCDPETGVGCDRRTDLDSYNITQSGWAVGLFLQDTWWTPLSWLTINPGVRFDYGATYNRRAQRMTSLFGIGPRLGFTADVTRNARNILFGYLGRSTDPMPLGVIATMDETEAGATRTYEYDATAVDVPVAQRYTRLLSQSGGPGGVLITKDPTIPRTDEITVGTRHELYEGTMTGVEYSFRRISHDWDAFDQNRVWDPSGQRVVDYVDKSKWGRTVTLYTTPYNPRLYHGVVFQSEGRPSGRWDYHLSHTLSWTNYRSSTSNPHQARFAQGWSSADIRHYTRIQFGFFLFPDLNLGAVFNYRSQGGDTLTKGFYNRQLNDRSNARSPAGTTPTTPNDPDGIAEFRPPAYFNLNLRLNYDVLPRRFRHHLHFIADIFNVFNTRTPTVITASDNAFFGQVANRQGPIRLQLGLNYTY